MEFPCLYGVLSVYLQNLSFLKYRRKQYDLYIFEFMVKIQRITYIFIIRMPFCDTAD